MNKKGEMGEGQITLIADSGSTKTDWLLGGRAIETAGINPVVDSWRSIAEVISSLPDEGVGEAYFYGAGCTPPYSETVRQALRHKYPNAQVHVESDLLGAARALCQRSEGIACILGTGSNSCLYNGERIVANTPPLGYMLGDEGSGATLGRMLVGQLLKGQLAPGLKEDFFSRFRLSQTDIMDRVYRQPMPNRFLASLVPFLATHRDAAAINSLLVAEFRRFVRHNVAPYRRPDLPLNFVGGVAHSFRGELAQAVAQEGLTLGKIEKSPIDKMEEYHTLRKPFPSTRQASFST